MKITIRPPVTKAKEEQWLRWVLRSACIGGGILGVLVPVWEESWTGWGIVTSASFVILILYGYSKLIPLEVVLAKKIVTLIDGFAP